MLTDYTRAAMRHARYEILPADGTFHGSIPGFLRGSPKLRIAGPHGEDIGRDLLVRILHEGGIDRGDWEAL